MDASDDPAALVGFESTATWDAATGDDGKLHLEGLFWGDYYLEEITPPTGFAPLSGEAAKVYFSVGRNNTDGQELSMQSTPETALLELRKHIDERNVEVWGAPTFLFKLTQTQYYKYTIQKSLRRMKQHRR